jgi:hypothetical protein
VTRSTWSGGVTWSGTAKWMPDGLTASGPLVPEVAIGGTLRTGLQQASWRLGISDFLAELSPGSCSLSFAGDVAVLPGDSIVLSIPTGVLWVGRVDTVSNTRGADGHQWTTVNGTDGLGALGATGTSPTNTATVLDAFVEQLAADAGVTLDIVDDSVSGLPTLVFNLATETMTILAWANRGAKSSNAMLALHRDGTIHAVVREAVTPADQVDITDRYSSRTKTTSADTNINRWVLTEPGVPSPTVNVSDTADIALYGERAFTMDDYIGDGAGADAHWLDWTSYGGSQRPIRSYVLPMRSWADDDLMLLDPFDWVTADGSDYQIMGLEHSVSASPPVWTVTLAVDDLLDLL